MELSGRKTEKWERKNMKKKDRKAATSLEKREGEGEGEKGKEIGREGGRREDMLNSVSVVKLAHSEGQPSHEQINNCLQVAHGCMLYPLISDNLRQCSGHLSLMAWVIPGTGKRRRLSVLNIPYFRIKVWDFYQWPRNNKAFLKIHLP